MSSTTSLRLPRSRTVTRHLARRVKATLTGRVVVFILIPDQVQPRVFNETFAPNLKDDVTIVVASGYNVFFKLLKFKPSQDVVMVAPRFVL